jgi:hypothetical protein
VSNSTSLTVDGRSASQLARNKIKEPKAQKRYVRTKKKSPFLRPIEVDVSGEAVVRGA